MHVLKHLLIKPNLLIQQLAEVLLPPLQHFDWIPSQLSTILLPHCAWSDWSKPDIHLLHFSNALPSSLSILHSCFSFQSDLIIQCFLAWSTALFTYCSCFLNSFLAFTELVARILLCASSLYLSVALTPHHSPQTTLTASSSPDQLFPLLLT